MADATESIRLESARFGSVEVKKSDLLHFPGLPGFPEACRFVVMEHDRSSCFAWLVCVDEPALAFAITDPWQFFPDYAPPVVLAHLEALEVKKPDELEILAIATFDGAKTLVNLAAPLLVNPRNRKATQVVFDRCDYSTRQPLPEPQAAPPAPEGEAAPR